MSLSKGKLLAKYKKDDGEGFLLQTRNERFMDLMRKEMSQRNPNGDWEAPSDEDSESFKQTCDSRYFSDDEVFDEFLSGKTIRLYEMGKNGLMLTNKYMDDYPIKLLPACRTGFCRDWKHDGICAAVEDKDADKCRRSGGDMEWFSNQNKCFDLSFDIRDVGATTSRHSDRIVRLEQRMAEKEITFNDILGDWATDNIEYEIVGSMAWGFRQEWEGWKRPRQQRAVKQIKSWVNGQTRKYISERLKDNDIPPSYDTAFYMKYLPQVNTVMKEVARRLI